MKRLLVDQRGIVLPIVVALVAIITLLGFTAGFMVQNQTFLVRRLADREEALYVAEEGVHKYLWHFNKDPGFYLDDDSYPILEDNYDHTIYSSLREQEEGDNYRVEIVIPKERVDGVYVPVSNRAIIRSTAWSGGNPEVKRTVEVEIRKRTFTEHGMVNNTEFNPESGEKVYWVDGEKFYGPLHTNDTLYISGKPTFYGPVTYKVGVDPQYKMSSTEIFRQGVSYADVLGWPSNVDNLMIHARIGGHYYNGRTCIMLRGDKYDVRYWDKDDQQWKYNGVPYEYITGGKYKNLDTGAVYNNFRAFADTVPSLTFPSNHVIYVNGNYGDQGDGGSKYGYKFDRDYGNVFVSGRVKGSLTIAAANDIFITGYDPTDWRDPRYNNIESTGGIQYSDTTFEQVFEDGDWKHTKVQGTGQDMLGLVANRKILILHYNWPADQDANKCYWGGRNNDRNDPPIDVAPYDINIHGALFVRDGSFGFEYPESGSGKGTIYLVGSVTGQYRGIVGNTAGKGYNKVYSHDPRMKFDAPPHFVQPANTGWEILSWKEIVE
jgi:hypothetical protein